MRIAVLVTGSSGQLGTAIKKLSKNYEYNFYFKTKEELDITNYSNFKIFLKNYEVQIIINCAAYTDVNLAEIEKKKSNQINNTAVGFLAKICSELRIRLIHLSTDYVFDGSKKTPYKESDKTNPINYYGLTKLNGEKNILKYQLENSVIIRTSWLYSEKQNNFVSNILKKIKKSEDIYITSEQYGSPTNAYDLAGFILYIIPRIKNKKTLIYHFSNEGFCSRLEFAQKINELVGGSSKIISKIIRKKNEIRPKFSALDSGKIVKLFNFKNLSWSESLKNHLQSTQHQYAI